MIGIGLTTCLRPAVLQDTLQAIAAFVDRPYRLAVVCDGADRPTMAVLEGWQPPEACEAYRAIPVAPRGGPALAKNRCLLELGDCDLVFLLDDDCRPARGGWIDFFLDAHRATGIHHFSYLTPAHGDPVGHEIGGFAANVHPRSGGVFMTVTAAMRERVGGFHPGFRDYAHYFHASYAQRVHRAGLQAGLGPYVSLRGTSDYLHALDYDRLDDSHDASGLGSLPEREQRRSRGHNWRIYRRDARGPIFRPLVAEPPGRLWPWLRGGQ